MIQNPPDLTIPHDKQKDPYALCKGTWAFSIRFGLDHRALKMFMLANQKLFSVEKFTPEKSNNLIMLPNGISVVEYHLTEPQEKKLIQLLSNKDITQRFQRTFVKEMKKQSQDSSKRRALDLSVKLG